MNQEHHKKDIRTNSVGATHDIDKELSGVENKGTYYDSENGRVSSDRGNKGSWEKIRGEQLVKSNFTTGVWYCMVAASINNDIFELWVETSGAQNSKIIINGSVMGESANFPWLYAHHIQFDINENCIGGEIFLTDFNVPPMIFSIKDIKDNFGVTQKYFTGFNPDLYYINLTAPLDVPIFRELVSVGAGGGLPVGSYQYALRYTNDEGDKTNWGVLTPPIPVLQSVDNSTTFTQYHGIKSYGADADLINVTQFGVALKFRVTNINNYRYVEIRRVNYNTEAGIDVVSQGVIIAKLEIADGEISVREFIDPVNANIDEETLADNEENYELSTIEKAKAIRYYDKKLVLMNYEVSSKETSATIEDINGEKIIPVLRDLGSLGFNNPVNHAYYKNYQSGEKYSFGINMFDGGGGAGFVFEDDDLKNIQAPNRRDIMSTDSKNLSYGDKPTAATVDSTVDNVFEIFDHENAIGKTGETGENKRNISTAGTKDGFPASDVGYEPLRPVDKNDVKTDHNYRINNYVRDSGNNDTAYNPECFQLDYYSKGFAIGGVTNIPSWVKSFSVVRSDRAGRVVCQGIGMYKLSEITVGPETFGQKSLDSFWFHSPDIESGQINPAILQDMQDNPSNYEIQLVSPLGFFSEVYNFNNISLEPDFDRIIDMVSYARVLHDEGQINPNEDANMGIDGSGDRYVAYNRYRNTSDTAGDGAFSGSDGNKIFTLDSFSVETDGRSTYYSLTLPENIYNLNYPGILKDFDEQEAKDFTEPMYIINIIQTGKVVKDLNINNYKSTGHYQKLESIIGVGDNTDNQTLELVDERWEDCIPSLLSTDFNSAGESFVFLRDNDGTERIYLNVTHLSGPAIIAITDDITNNGFYLASNGYQVVGIYTHSIDVNGVISLVFNYSDYNPLIGEKIIVKYDSTRPIVFFGGDTVVNENIFAPIDRESDWSISELDNQFPMGLPFPYRRYDLNQNYYVVEDTFLNNIQASDKCRIGYIRQMCMMYAAESVTATNFAFNSDYPLAYFPLTHYIMRPGKFDDASFGGDPADIANDNDLYPEYFDDYPNEWELWKYGGFRFLPQFNFDYSVKGPTIGFSKPDVGFEEENTFCTGVKWSLSRATNQQDSPGLKTFLAGNTFILDDDNGGIVKAWSARTDGKGDNLYAITIGGICLLLTKKSILSNLTGDDLTTTSFDNFIGDQYWISREIGSNGEMWRGMADASIEMRTQGGKTEGIALFIPNSHSVYRLMDNVVVDIAKDNYHTRIKDSLKAILSGYGTKITGHFDKNHNEYWFQMPDLLDLNKNKCFVFSQDTGFWAGRFTYNFDKYLFFNNKNYGFKFLAEYELDKGFIIQSNPITAYLIQHTSVELVEEKEFITIEVNTGPRGTMKPTEIIFLDETGVELSRLNQALFGQSYLKQYNGWWNQIPRKELSVSPNRERIQYRLFMYKIIHTFEEDFKVVSSVVQYKNLK